MSGIPERIVCLSAEAGDWLWRIGAWEQVVGVTAFFTLPPGATRKPRVSGFNSANLEQIAGLKPDLVVTFSEVQARLAAELVRRGRPVLATNQRTLAEIETTLALLARVAGRETEAEAPLREFRERLAPLGKLQHRPRTYFEEWSDPLISGIGWISELIGRAGGDDIFPELRDRRSAPERVVTHERVRAANPEVILASWCGEPVQPAIIAARPGWRRIEAVSHRRIHEIRGADILQAGFRLVYGYEQIKSHLQIPTCAALSH
jgi:iron complex transport system substrate-binding protein